MALVTTDFNINITPGAMPPVVHVSEYDIGRSYTVGLIGENNDTFTIPTGTTATIDGTLNGVVGFSVPATISNNKVAFTLTESMTAYAGKAWCKIKLTLNDEPIQTCAFILAVDRAGVEAETVIGADGFQEQINQAVAEYIEDSGLIIDSTLSRQGAAADAKATGDAISALSEEKVNKSAITLGVNEADGLVYIFIGGQPVGNGLDLSGGGSSVTVYGSPVADTAMYELTGGQTVTLGIKLSRKPTQDQTITLLSDSDLITFSVDKLTFTAADWSDMQFVTITVGSFDTDTTASIIMRNSDELMTDTTIPVYLVADMYSVDTTIPDGVHLCTIDDFAEYGITNSGTNYRWLGAYTGGYTNIIVPSKMVIDGAEYDIIVKTGTFSGNTIIEYVQLEDGVNFSEYGRAGTDMIGTFSGCTQLIGVKYAGDKLTKIDGAFNGCTSLKFFDGIGRQLGLISASRAFMGCTALEYLPDLSGLTKLAGTSGSVGMYQFCSGCANLKKVYGLPMAFESACTFHNAFYNCTALEQAIIPANAAPVGYAFGLCTSLRKCEIYNDDLTSSNNLNTYTFQNCENLSVFCNDGSITHETLLSEFGSSTSVTVLTFGGAALPSVVIWGDSTTSPGTAWKCWPDRLQEKLGTSEYLVKNEAVSGEFTTSTSARQGGNSISVAAFTIPADTEPVGVTMTSEDGQIFSSSPVFSAGGSFNPCTIADVEGVISPAGTTPQIYNFTRRTSGVAVDSPDGTLIVSKADETLNAANNVMIVELGNNAGWKEDPSVLLNQMQLMVNHFTKNGGTKYILFGPFSGQYMRSAENRSKVETFETLAAEAFGDHFISIRQYLIDNGLSDNGLEASALDAERIAVGQIPASLIGGGTTTEINMYDGTTVTDDSHPNAYGANSIMLGIYAKGQALGYWT